MRLLLVRHGQSEGNASGVVQGHLDFGLTTLGVRQAEATAKRLAGEPIARVLTSPLTRATATAELIAASVGAAVEPEPGLREYEIGHVSGLTATEIAERHPEIPAAYRRGERPSFPGEEGREVFYKRIATVLDRWRQSGESMVAVAHGGVVSALCYTALGLDHSRPGIFRVANCSITEFSLERGRLVLRRHNDVCHLDGILTMEDIG
ncbi:MAG: histidine phosphatase family protein [Dehalococcoidia bacterium]|nr:histidine phosphatase family protein [Dehalococcoidia bacterium]